jgi:hypothetical protein
VCPTNPREAPGLDPEVVDAGAPVVGHRLVAAVADRDAVDRRPVRREVVCLPFVYPEDGVSKVLVGPGCPSFERPGRAARRRARLPQKLS